MSDNSTIIAEFDKNGRERIVVSLTEFKGKPYADIRVNYPADNGAMRPSAKGVMFKPSLLVKIIEALKDAEAEGRRRGWL